MSRPKYWWYDCIILETDVKRYVFTFVFVLNAVFYRCQKLAEVFENLRLFCAEYSPERRPTMVKSINGKFWYCCPKCGQKIHPVSQGAICSGVYVECRRCGWSGEMEIKRKGA